MSHVSTIRVIPWDPKYLEFFDLVGEAWSPPNTMRTVVNARRTRMTVEATFTNTVGASVKLTGRLEKDAAGTWWGVEEKLEQRFEWRREPVR